MITPEEVKSKTIERFWSKIKFGELNDCWEWNSSIDQNGYGRFGVQIDVLKGNTKRETRMRLASRYIYEAVKNDFNKVLHVLHNCPNGDNPKCVNPNHLWQGTQADNMHDMKNKGRARTSDQRGVKNGMAKLNEEDVMQIRSMAADGLFKKEISLLFGVTDAMICDIVNRKSWKHI